MKIAEYITENVFKPRLKKDTCLVIYDPENLYRELCLELEGETTVVVDTTESSLESRQTALRVLKELGTSANTKEYLLVYVPAKKPLTDDEKMIDPFALYGEIGAVFPKLDGDDFLSLCLAAKKDNETEIRQLFKENSKPTFEMVDSVGGGMSYPQLKTILAAESVRDILLSLLAPNEKQTTSLNKDENWVSEAKELFRSSIGLDIKTRAKRINNISDELWRFILFSEFAFDLPEELPASLKSVPSASPEAKPLIESVCNDLRNHAERKQVYIEKAEEIEKVLKLPEACSVIENFGTKDTFPFEERTFFKQAVKGIIKDNAELTRSMLKRQVKSVWQGKGESKVKWDLIKSALELIERCEQLEIDLPENSKTQSDLLDFYLKHLHEADRLQREFEQSVITFFDTEGLMKDVIRKARNSYGRLSEKVQTIFIKHLESNGWTPDGRLANAEVYDKFVGNKLKERGKKIAYIMVDALRYELGVELKKEIIDDGIVELHSAYANLPTITLVGMASLLPDAKDKLFLSNIGGNIVPKIDDVSVKNVSERMKYIRTKLNDRFAEMQLEKFVRQNKKIPAPVELLVLRSTEIDSQLESNPETTLGLIPHVLSMIRAALHKLRKLGFQEVVIATDHGFFLNAQATAGDVCIKPEGNWIVKAHDRVLLGEGGGDAHNLVVSADKVGIRGDFPKSAFPRSMAPYRDGYLYFHGGASLPEAVVPVITVKLESKDKDSKADWEVRLSYRKDAKKITTRLPVIDISLYSNSLFEQETEVLLEAQDKDGNVVGEPRLAGEINPATRTITLKAGESKQIVLEMLHDFEGKFTVKALDPTTLTTYGNLDLKTDYLDF
ncbi:MAG: PglZ domain-containing protein [Aridibacter sp.]